jgi:hypothetical protein
MNIGRSLAALTLVTLCALPAAAQEEEPRRRTLIGLNLGVYIPTSDKARDAFGATFLNFGFGLGRFRTPSAKGAFGFEYSFIVNRGIFPGGNNRAILVPLGGVYVRRLTQATSEEAATGWAPYAGASVNVIPNNIRADEFGVNSKWRFAAGGSLFVGAVWKGQYSIQARYYGMTSVAGINLSGLNLTTGFRF